MTLAANLLRLACAVCFLCSVFLLLDIIPDALILHALRPVAACWHWFCDLFTIVKTQKGKP